MKSEILRLGFLNKQTDCWPASFHAASDLVLKKHTKVGLLCAGLVKVKLYLWTCETYQWGIGLLVLQVLKLLSTYSLTLGCRNVTVNCWIKQSVPGPYIKSRKTYPIDNLVAIE